MRSNIYANHRDGFTRLELLIVLITVALLSTVGLSVLGNTTRRSDLVVCANNLRQVGRACHMWASDHGGENPWWTSYADGGSYVRAGGPQPPGALLNIPGYGPAPAALRNNAWVQLAYIYQELQTPAALVCPTDRTKSRAVDFSSDANHGYFSLNFQNRAVSYFIGMHALKWASREMLSGDRSLRETGNDSSCSANLGTAQWMSATAPQPQAWTPTLHVTAGNILLNDGGVEELSNTGLSKLLDSWGEAENGALHFLKP